MENMMKYVYPNIPILAHHGAGIPSKLGDFELLGKY
jgi:hypothetical protein